MVFVLRAARRKSRPPSRVARHPLLAHALPMWVPRPSRGESPPGSARRYITYSVGVKLPCYNSPPPLREWWSGVDSTNCYAVIDVFSPGGSLPPVLLGYLLRGACFTGVGIPSRCRRRAAAAAACRLLSASPRRRCSLSSKAIQEKRPAFEPVCGLARGEVGGGAGGVNCP